MKNTNKNLSSDYNAYVEADTHVLVNGVGEMIDEEFVTYDSDYLNILYCEGIEIKNTAYAKAKLIISELKQEVFEKQK